MNKDRLEDAARIAGGMEEMEMESAVTGQTVDEVRRTAMTFERWLRRTIETKPYTSVVVAVGLGWALGRMHRPL
jgi:hypothetical protein